MKLFFFTLLIAVLIFSYKSFAQVSATGCYAAYDNSVHTTNVMGVYANMTGRVPLLPNYCSWTPRITTTTCQVCPGNILNSTGQCRVSATDTTPLATVTGYLGTFNMIPCPLDDYVLLFVPFGAFVFARLRRNISHLVVASR